MNKALLSFLPRLARLTVMFSSQLSVPLFLHHRIYQKTAMQVVEFSPQLLIGRAVRFQSRRP